MSQERVSGFPEKGADLRGSPGNFRGSPGNFRGRLGNFRGTSGYCWVPQWQNFRGSRRKTSGEVRGTSGEARELPRSSGEPDSLPATRQIYLQDCAETLRSRPFPEILEKFNFFLVSLNQDPFSEKTPSVMRLMIPSSIPFSSRLQSWDVWVSDVVVEGSPQMGPGKPPNPHTPNNLRHPSSHVHFFGDHVGIVWLVKRSPPCPSLLFWKKARKTTKKTRNLDPYRTPKIPGKEWIPTEPLKSLEKKGKTLKKIRNFRAGEKSKEFPPQKKERKDRAEDDTSNESLCVTAHQNSGGQRGRCCVWEPFLRDARLTLRSTKGPKWWHTLVALNRRF